MIISESGPADLERDQIIVNIEGVVVAEAGTGTAPLDHKKWHHL